MTVWQRIEALMDQYCNDFTSIQEQTELNNEKAKEMHKRRKGEIWKKGKRKGGGGVKQKMEKKKCKLQTFFASYAGQTEQCPIFLKKEKRRKDSWAEQNYEKRKKNDMNITSCPLQLMWA